MSETLQQIRALLSDLESEVGRAEHVAEFRGLSGLELPDIIADVIDLLMPELKPYEAAFYMKLLRHSIIEQGTPYVRASRRGFQSGVVRSMYAGSTKGGKKDADSATLSYGTAQEAFEGLIAIGAIRQEGEPNREGTLYRVLLPEEIPACERRRAERATGSRTLIATEHEADFYNVRENRLRIYERDNYKCTYCGKQLTRFTATLDHITPVSVGGDNSVGNLKMACLQCNSRKTARPLGDFLIESKLES
jgi:hypothetical protein